MRRGHARLCWSDGCWSRCGWQFVDALQIMSVQKSHIVVSIPSRAWHEASLRSGCSALLHRRSAPLHVASLRCWLAALVTGVQKSQPIVAAAPRCRARIPAARARTRLHREGGAQRSAEPPDDWTAEQSPSAVRSIRPAQCGVQQSQRRHRRSDEHTQRHTHCAHSTTSHRPTARDHRHADGQRDRAERLNEQTTNKTAATQRNREIKFC